MPTCIAPAAADFETAAPRRPKVATSRVDRRFERSAPRRVPRRQARRPQVSRLLAWLLAGWLGPIGLSLAQVAPGALPASALPTGGQVVVGSGVLQHNPNLLVIQQNSQKLGLDWQSFNIGSGATVEFRQPNAGSIALNRVLGNSGTEIYGQLRANGQVFLTNPNGVLFAPGAKVDVGGLVASTLDLSQQDFADGRYAFNHTGGRGAVVNQGSLTASAGGYLVLFGNQVSNQGDIAVNAGSVVLASGRAATVSISGSGLLSAVVTPGVLDGRVDNSGRISADGSVVTLTAKSAQDIAASLVNNSGIVRANTLVEKAGEIWITGDQVASSGTLSVAAPHSGDAGRVVVRGDLKAGGLQLDGRIDATAALGRGGSVETSAAHVAIARDTRVDSRGAAGTGSWLIDPTDFTVAMGGAAQTASGIGADTLSTNLGTTSVTLQTAAGGSEPGDIHVNAAVSWSANTALTLTATRDINVNASITATGAGAALALNSGAGRFFNVNATDSSRPTVSLSGVNATLAVNGASYTLVRDLAGLQAMNSGLAGRYALMADIDASSTATNGFVPIGNETSSTVTSTGAFSGVFDGMGHRISGLTINRPSSNATGLFASTSGATLRNFELFGGAVSGSQHVGAVAGYTRGATTVHNVRSSASVSVLDDGSAGVWAGGLVGRVEGSTAAGVLRSVATGTVAATSNSATAYAGGLAGEIESGVLTNVSAGGNVTVTLATGSNDSGHYVGGLAGYFSGGNVTTVSATGSVTGGHESGGLIGRFQPASSSTLTLATASGNVTGTGDVGGLVGHASGSGAIANASATGSVSTTVAETLSFHAGGAVGRYGMTGAPSAVSASGNVSGGNTTGGVVGWIESNVALASGSLVSAAPGGGATKTVTGPRWVGGLIGYSDSSSAFSGLSADAVVTATGSQGAVGGLIGRINSALNNSSSSGSVTGVGGDIGGLVGRAQGAGGMNAVSSASSVTSSASVDSVGGVVGYVTNTGGITNATATGNVSGGRYTGGVVGLYSSNGNLQTLRSEGSVTGAGDVGGLVGYANGSGTLSGADALGTVQSSATTSYSVGGAVGYFAMTGGLANVTAAGNVSGGGQTGGVIGYYTPTTAIAAGALSYVNSASRSVTGASWVGGLIGYSNASAIGAHTVAAAVTHTGTSGGAGGLAGRTGGSLINSSASGAVVSGAVAGGLVGQADGTAAFTDVSASGAVRGRTEVGGLVGSFYSSATLLRATATGAVSTNGSGGGLVGYHNGGAITDSSASGHVSGLSDSTTYLGGLVGQYGASCYFCSLADGYVVSNSQASGTVRADAAGSFTGGLIGLVYSGVISNSNASGAVTSRDSVSAGSNEYTGGLVGYFGYYNERGSISGSNATGAVNGGYYNGGLVGFFNGAGLSNSTAAGAVSNGRETGGLIGYGQLYGPVSNVSATGAVTSTDSTASGAAGGLMGTAYLYISSGQTAGGSITNASASGAVTVARTSGNVGGLIGDLNASSNGSGPVNDSRASGNVSGGSVAGGLLGRFSNGNGYSALLNSSASGSVTGNGTAGGLVGVYQRSATTGRADDITNSSASGRVSGNLYLGGLVGQFDGRYGIVGSYATGDVVARDVTGVKYMGGLVGYYYGRHTSTSVVSAITASYATGQVRLGSNPVITTNTDIYAGGLVGYLDGSLSAANGIVDAYASGTVTLSSTSGRLYAGGLVGYAASGQGGLRTYASGAVSATGGNTRSTGGLLAGRSTTAAVFTDSDWNSTTTGQASSLGGGTARTTAEMQSAGSFSGWSLATTGAGGTVWRIYDGYTAPLLTRFLTPRTLSLADASKAYDGTRSFGNATLTAINGSISFPERIFVATPSGDVGSYSIAAAGVYSVQNGYDLTVTGSATLSVTPRAITLAGLVADKVYDGTRTATLLGTAQPSGVVAGEALTVNIAGATAVFDTKNVGQGKAVTITGLSLADGPSGKASNYQLADASASSANVTPATLNAGGFTATHRAYDGSTTVAVSAAGGAVSGIFGSDDVSVNLGSVSSGSIADKNVGTAKPVTVLGATLTGADAGNYVIGGINSTTVDITPRTLTINGLLANNRVYNQQLTVSVPIANGVISGAVPGDVLQLRNISVTGTMADRHAGDGKTVTVPGSSLQLRGPDATNYTVANAASTVNIARATVSLYADYYGTSNDKVYDGTDTATTTPYFYSNAFGYLFAGTSTVGPDSLTLSHDTPRYSDKNVAYTGSTVTTKTITVANAVLGGTDQANYILDNTSATTSGRITPRSLTVAGVSAVNRAYDGSVNVTVNVTGATVDTSAVVPGDSVTVTVPGTGTVVGTMTNKNVGAAKPVTVPGFSLGGGDAGNYSLNGSNGVTVDITRKALTAVYTALDKVYDGNAYANMNVASADIVAGDQVLFYANTAQYGCFGCYSFFVTDTSTPTSYTLSKDAGNNKRVVVTGNGLFGSDAANYTLLNSTATVTASVTPKGITPVFTGVNRVYDGTTAATVNVNTSASGIVAGDAVNLARTATFADRNAGTGKTVTITDIAFTGAAAGNYTLTTNTASTVANITPKTLGVAGVTASDRIYDGSTTVALTVGSLGASGLVGSDTVSVNAPSGGISTGTLIDKRAGLNKAVTVAGLTLSGADATNYTIDGGLGVTANIARRPLTVSYTGQTREYNGGVSASVAAGSADIVAGDVLTFTQNAVFTGLDGRNVGTNKPISVTSIVPNGTDSGNYALQNTTASTTGSITPKAITVSYTGLSRVYNGLADTRANVAGLSFGIVGGDQVGFTQTATFTGNGAAGTGKAVNVSNIALTGAQGTNYSLINTTATTTASITPRQLGVTGVIAANRVYDGTTVVQLSTLGATVLPSGVLAGDDVGIVLPSGGITTGTMATKDAGNNKPVSITGLTLSGTSAANYSVGGNGLTVNITPRSLTAAYAAANRVYDGTALASISGSSTDILSVDIGALGISASGQFIGGKNVGVNKAVAVSGGFLTGAERNNYSLLNATGLTTASITPRDLTAIYDGGTRVYDGGVNAPATARSTGVLAGDVLSFAQTAVFTGADAKNVGSGKAISVSGITLNGADAANYRLTGSTASATGGITPKSISIDGITGVTATNRVYDGTRAVEVVVSTSGSISPSSADIVAGDAVTINLPAGGITGGTMANKNAGNNKAVVVDGLTLSGTDAGNYVVAATTGITVNIARKAVTAVYTGIDRVYDGSTSASATGSSADLIPGDAAVIGATGVFTGIGARNVGSSKAISLLSGSLSGSDAANYALVNTTGNTTADVTPKLVVPTYAGLDKVYDGTTNALVAASTSAVVAGDTVQFGQTAVFTGNRNVGTNKAIAVSGITLSGNDAANYALTATSASTTGNITPRPLRIDGLTGVTATDRVYNGSNIVSVVVSASGPIAPNPQDLIAGDVVTVNAPTTGITTGTMLDKNVGSAKPVAVAGLDLAGADAANYSIAAASGVTVNITPRPLTAVYTAPTREYDGSTAASLVGSSADIIAGDVLSITGIGVFSGTGAKNAGTGKQISISTVSFGGADAANYSLLNPTGTATGTITPRGLTVSYLGGSRVYDGTVAAPVTGTADRFVAGDDIRLVQTAIFTGSGAKNAGIDKLVNISGIGLTGADAANYSVNISSTSTLATVTRRPLRIEGFTGVVASDRVYDGTTAVAITATGSGSISANPADLIAGDDIGVVAPATGTTAGVMADKNVGSNKPVTVSGVTLSGADAGNYLVAAASGVTVNITPKPLLAVYAGVSRVYDGTATVAITGSSVDIVAGDLVGITGSGLFTGADAKNVGTGKAISISTGALVSAAGNSDALNYRLLNTTGTATANVTPKTLVATYTGGTRVYDGSTSAPVTGVLDGRIEGDSLGVSQTAVFTGSGARNVGDGKAVLVSGITLTGSDAINYSLLADTVSTVATITPRLLNVGGLSGLQAVDRVYDGTRDVQITGTLVAGPTSIDVVAGDDVRLNLPGGNVSAGRMVDKAAGTAKSVAVAGLSLSGADATNYQIVGIAGLTVNIAPRPVVLLGVSVQDRAYDGSTLVAINAAGGSLSGVLAGDELRLRSSGVSGTMADKNVGTGKAVTVSGLSFEGTDVGNYTVSGAGAGGTGGLTVNITPRALLASAVAADKVYNGNANAAVTLSGDALAGDDLRLAASSAFFATANAGNGLAVNVSGLSLAGADAGNYSLTANSLTTTASIQRRPLTVAAHTLSKIYGDVLTPSSSNFSVDGLVQGESLGTVLLASAGTGATANAGSYTLSIGGASGGSFNPDNYRVSYVDGRVNVAPRPLTIAANSVVRFADQANPTSFGYSTSVGGLTGADSLASVLVAVPPASVGAPAVSVFDLQPSGAVFATGTASNYAITYGRGVLLVLPTPPRVDDVNAGGERSGNTGFAVQVDPAEVERAEGALARNATVAAQLRSEDNTLGTIALPALREASAAAIAGLLSGDSGRITLPDLQRMPLISFEPGLRRLLMGERAAAPEVEAESEPARKPTPATKPAANRPAP